jgi:hypothetical protein
MSRPDEQSLVKEAIDDRVSRAWELEVNRRAAQLDAGDVACVQWEKLRVRLIKPSSVNR